MNEDKSQQRAEALQLIQPYRLDARVDYPEPYYMLEYNGVPFSTLGGIQAISGQKKNGKTFVLAQLMAAVLGTGVERTEHYLPGLRVPERTLEHLREKKNDKDYLPKVLYVDTEMEKLNSAKVLRRVHWLCNWDTNQNQPEDRFNVLWLRAITDQKDEEGRVIWKAFQQRWNIITAAIDALEPDMVIIDGVRDIIGDFNNNEQSAALVSELMSLAEQRGICIWGALHMNPRPGNDDESKMRGHLGTELGNKVTDTLVSIKSKSANGVIFTVKQQDARGKDLDDWQFEVTDDAGNLGIPKIISVPSANTTSRIEADSKEDLKKWIDKAIETYTWPMRRKDIKKKVFGEIGGQKNDGKQQADLQAAINYGLLHESTVKENGYYLLMYDEDLPF